MDYLNLLTKSIRIKNKFTQKEFGEVTKYSEATIKKYEYGKSKVSNKFLLKLLRLPFLTEKETIIITNELKKTPSGKRNLKNNDEILKEINEKLRLIIKKENDIKKREKEINKEQIKLKKEHTLHFLENNKSDYAKIIDSLSKINKEVVNLEMKASFHPILKEISRKEILRMIERNINIFTEIYKKLESNEMEDVIYYE